MPHKIPEYCIYCSDLAADWTAKEMRFVSRHGTFVQIVQTRSTAHVALTRGSFPVNKPAGSEVRPSPKLRMHGAAPPFPICPNDAQRNCFVF